MWFIGLVFAVAPSDQPAPESSVESSESAEVDAQAVYSEHCQTCHGKNGRATFPGVMMSAGSFASKGFWKGRPDERLRETVVRGGEAMGLKKAMPAFGDELSDAEIDAVMSYILAFRPE